MKILISHVYANGNKGDAALLSVLIQDIKRAYPDATIAILSMDAIAPGEQFDGVPVYPSFMHYVSTKAGSLIQRLLYGISTTLYTLSWALWYRITDKSLVIPKQLQDVVHQYQDADLIISVGGGYIRAQKGIQNTAVLFFILHPFLFSWIMGKKTIGYTQSVGPFGSSLQRRMAKSIVRRLSGIIAREHISEELLHSWNVQNVYRSVDSGFLFDGNSRTDSKTFFGFHDDRIVIGVTVRTWLSKEAQEHYERTMAAACDEIIEAQNATIVFIPQVTVPQHHDDDRESSKRVYEYMRHKEHARVVTEEYDHHTIKSLYGGLDYLIGTRFHSVIFALTSFVPTIAIGYEYKTIGIMEDLGLESWVLDINNFTKDQLVALFKKLVNEKELFLTYAKKRLPGYIAKARGAITYVQAIVVKEI